MPNRLAHETSPYLLQHADNPVDWYPWGQQAFDKARAEDKPLLLSIGYAACHWCHVMAHESFESEATARVVNERFVPVKVDREERPDVDAIYMQAVQSLTGHGGWPLTVFLLPDGRPFYGGTYFPMTDRYGMPSFSRVLHAVHDAYANRRDDVLGNASLLTDALERAAAPIGEPAAPDYSLTDGAFQGLAAVHDRELGGFGGAPKFPQSMAMEFLLRYHARTGNAQALDMVESSLEAMARGGIYDHVGGGFHRYSTDARWLVPHFEKMLYDNALLASAYTQAYRVTRNDAYRTVARETLDYLLRELRDPAGGFYSSQDADSEGVEGKYYVWERGEVADALGAHVGVLVERYGVSEGGNWEGRSILNIQTGAEWSPDALRAERDALLRVRATRVPPETDTKVLTGWNGLAVRALAEAAAAFDDARYRDIAAETARFLLGSLERDGRLLRSWTRGEARLKGYLEDYAQLIAALLAVHEATFAHEWLHAAHRLTDKMLELFWGDGDGLAFDVGSDHERLIVRPRDVTDNALPCGSSAAAEVLVRMARLTGDERYAEGAERLFASVSPLIARYPLGFGNWLKALELYLAPSTEVVLVGKRNAAGTKALLAGLYGRFRPGVVVVGLEPGADAPFPTPLLEGRGALNGQPTAYVCHRFACELPTADAAELMRQLDG